MFMNKQQPTHLIYIICALQSNVVSKVQKSNSLRLKRKHVHYFRLLESILIKSKGPDAARS